MFLTIPSLLLTVANATISKRPYCKCSNRTKQSYGQPDPVFAYSIGSGTLVAGHTWTGALSRQPGENVGNYNYITSPLIITDAGSNNVTANYDITYGSSFCSQVALQLLPATTPLVITADNYTKFRCAADPVLSPLQLQVFILVML
jgi:hypothetical protein